MSHEDVIPRNKMSEGDRVIEAVYEATVAGIISGEINLDILNPLFAEFNSRFIYVRRLTALPKSKPSK